jgi:hypothetical protein
MQAEGLHGIQAGVERVGDMTCDAMNKYNKMRKDIPSFGPEMDKRVETYVMALDHLMIGILLWSFECERYFGEQHADVAKTFQLNLSPVLKIARGKEVSVTRRSARQL